MIFASPTGSKLCTSFVRLSYWTWGALEAGSLLNILPGEESITDMLLLYLGRRHPVEVTSWRFTKADESINGADWEWWVGKPGEWIGARIQAKKLSPKKQRYQGLARQDKGVYQVDKLIKAVQGRGTYPLYCFYNAWDPIGAHSPSWRCGTYDPDLRMLGCAIADAYEIKGLILNKRTGLSDVLRYSNPWSCLVCCPQARGLSTDGLAVRFRRFLSEVMKVKGDVPRITQNLPDEIEAYLGRHQADIEGEGGPEGLGWLSIFSES